MASNKGKGQGCGRQEGALRLFGGFSKDGRYVIKIISVRRTMAKGEVRQHEMGCEHDVFTYCLYHGKFARINDSSDGKKSNGKGKKRQYADGVDADRWDAAAKKAEKMLEQCSKATPATKMAKLRQLTKDAKVRITFGR